MEVVIDKFLLKGSVVAFNIGIDFGTPGIGKEVGNPISFKGSIKGPQIFTPIIGLPDLDLPGINRLETLVEILHIPAGELLVGKRKGKAGFDLHGTVEVVPDPIGEPFHGVRQNVTELRGLRGPFDLDPFVWLWALDPVGGWIVVNPSCPLEKEFVASNEIADGGYGDQGQTLLPTEAIQQRFDLLFTQPWMSLPQVPDIPDHLEGDCGGSDPSGTGGVRNQRREFPVPLPQSPPPPTDELSVGPEGLLGCRLSIGLVELQDLHAPLRNFAFAKASEAPEHRL